MTTPNRSVLQTRSYDWGLISIVTALLLLGAVMVFSASFAQGIYGFGDPYYFITKQLIWAVVGVAAMIIAAWIPYPFWQRWSVPIMGITLLALIAVIFLGDDTFGSTRTFFGGRVQPSEPAKIAIIIYISTWLASKGSSIRNVKVGLAPFAVLLGIITLLLISQPDISTAIIIVTTAFLMFFIAGAEIRQLIIVGSGGTITFWLIIQYSSYARDRVDLFLESFRNPILSTEWQVEQAIRAFVRGGVFGVGLGNAQAKLPGHLPVSWSDNIFAVIGEELGLVGAIFVMILFGLLAYRGLRTALIGAGQLRRIAGDRHHCLAYFAGAAQYGCRRGDLTAHRCYIAIHQLRWQLACHCNGWRRHINQYWSRASEVWRRRAVTRETDKCAY